MEIHISYIIKKTGVDFPTQKINTDPYSPCPHQLHSSGTATHIAPCMFPDLGIIAFFPFPRLLAIMAYRDGIFMPHSLTEASVAVEKHSSVTVAGPCRIFTCFHLSLIM